MGIFMPFCDSKFMNDSLGQMVSSALFPMLCCTPLYIYMYKQSNNVYVRKIMKWFIVMTFIPLVFLILSIVLYNPNTYYENGYNLYLYIMLSQFLVFVVNLYIVIMLYKNITKI